MIKRVDWQSYECITMQHSACDGVSCACTCHGRYPHPDDDDYWEDVEPPNDNEP